MEGKRTFWRHYTVLILVAAVLTLVFCTQSSSAASQADLITVDVTAKYGQTEARSMLDMVNDLRTGSNAWYWNETDTEKINCTGLEDLTYDYDLEKAAMQRAMELVLSYSHERPNGENCFTAYEEEGISYQAAGENIAIGYPSAAAVFEAWAEEQDDYDGQGHRRNMLSENTVAIGIGHVIYKGTHYWVQEFASPVSNRTETTAADNEKTVSVELLQSKIQEVSVTASPKNHSLALGESKELPTVSGTIRMADTWGLSAEIPLSCTWS